MSVKNRIKVLRAEQNWSQEVLGKRLGVSRQAINAIEREKHDPSLQLAFSIAEVFKVTVEEVFTPENIVIHTEDEVV